MLDVSSLSGIDLFKHLPDSCLEALEEDRIFPLGRASFLEMFSNSLRIKGVGSPG
jgi:hypothetical protein